MDVDEHFDPTDDDPPVPDKLLDRSLKYLPTLVRVDVERKRGTNSWKKVNGFKCDQSPSGEPKDSAEDVSTMIVMVALSHVEETGEDGQYRAKFHVTLKGGKVQRKTFAFRLSADDDEPQPVMDDLEHQEVLAVAFDRAIALIEIQNRHIDVQNQRILEQAQVQSGQTAPLLATIETLVNKYHEGLNMQATALQALFDNEKNLKVEEGKIERDKALLDILAVAAPKAFEQFGNYLQGRAPTKALPEGDKSSTEAESQSESESDQPAKATVIQTQPRPQPKAAAQDQSEPQEPPHLENPLTVFAHAFRESIASDQWMQLSEALSKNQMKLLRTATTAEEDDVTAEGIMVFRDALKPTQYLRLQRVLDEQQQAMIARLIELIERYEELHDEPEGSEGHEDGDEEPEDES
jgi:hypothetical protein